MHVTNKVVKLKHSIKIPLRCLTYLSYLWYSLQTNTNLYHPYRQMQGSRWVNPTQTRGSRISSCSKFTEKNCSSHCISIVLWALFQLVFFIGSYLGFGIFLCRLLHKCYSAPRTYPYEFCAIQVVCMSGELKNSPGSTTVCGWRHA